MILSSKSINITGKKYNRLTVIEPVFQNHYGIYWRCKCACGNEIITLSNRIRYGKTKSCGCLGKEILSQRDKHRENNPNWKGGNPKCKICGKELANRSIILCQKCYTKKLKGKNNPNYKHGKTKNNKCIVCGAHICRESTRCIKCAGEITSIRQRGKKNPMYGRPAHHSKRIIYKNTKLRSSYELAYARYLDKKCIEWLYEPKAFDLGNTTYTPDFYLPKTNIYIEVKGWWRDDAKKKFYKFKRKYKNIKIILLNKNKLKKLKII